MDITSHNVKHKKSQVFSFLNKYCCLLLPEYWSNTVSLNTVCSYQLPLDLQSHDYHLDFFHSARSTHYFFFFFASGPSGPSLSLSPRLLLVDPLFSFSSPWSFSCSRPARIAARRLSCRLVMPLKYKANHLSPFSTITNDCWTITLKYLYLSRTITTSAPVLGLLVFSSERGFAARWCFVAHWSVCSVCTVRGWRSWPAF